MQSKLFFLILLFYSTMAFSGNLSALLSGSGSSGKTLKSQEFTSSGTWVKPSGVTVVSKVECIGGGGGGAGGQAKRGSPDGYNSSHSGGGGGSGVLTYRENIIVTGDVVVMIGSGGAGGSSAATSAMDTAVSPSVAPTTGNPSSFGTYVIALGGMPANQFAGGAYSGASGSYNSPGKSVSNINTISSAGGYGYHSSQGYPAQNGGYLRYSGESPGSGTYTPVLYGGGGGGAGLGVGGNGGAGSNTGNASNGTAGTLGSGGGGGGGCYHSTNNCTSGSGGSGGSGYCAVYWLE